MEKTRLSLFLALSLIASNGHSRTREDVIGAANIYANYGWSVGGNNILDEKRYITTSTSPQNGQQDGIDDRMGAIADINRDEIIDRNDITTQNRRNWPFSVGDPVTGEAYAWGGWKGGLKWGAETTNNFEVSLAAADKWIAGGRKYSDIPASGETVVPAGYKGYTGIDCSGFVGNALDIGRFAIDKYKLNTSSLQAKSLPVEPENLRRGDIIVNPGDHVAMFLEWIDKPRVARIIHASYLHYSENIYKYRVVRDSATVTGVVSPKTLPATPNQGYFPYSPFPQFTWATPVKVDPANEPFPVFDPLGPAPIELTIKTGNSVKVKISSITLVLDEGGATEVRIANN